MNIEKTDGAVSQQPEDGLNRLPLSDRKRKAPEIDDYLLPAIETQFATPIPVPPERTQPDELLRLVAPHLPRHMLKDWRNPQSGLDFECELVFVASESEEQSTRLAVQRTTATAISREFVNLSANGQLLKDIEDKFTDDYRTLVSNTQPAVPKVPVHSGDWGEWNIVREMAYRNREFAVLNHIMSQAPSGWIRFEHYNYDTLHLVSDRKENTTYCEPVEKPALIYSHLTCSPTELKGRRAVKVNAHLPWEWSSQRDQAGDMFDTTFYVLEDEISIPNEAMDKILTRMHSEGRTVVFGYEKSDEGNAVKHRIRTFWRDFATVISRRPKWEWAFAGTRYLSPYSTKAFGQELKVDNHGRPWSNESIRVFDANEEGSKLRDQKEVAARIYMTVDEAREQEEWEQKTIKKFIDEIIPSTKDLTPEQALVYAAEVTTKSVEPLRLLESKLSLNTRLAIIGMIQHPLEDKLPLEIIDQTKKLGIHFIAVPIRNPDDPTRIYKENKEGLVAIKVDGMTVEMSHEEAQRKHPDQYRRLFRENQDWDEVVAVAREKGLDILYAQAGDSWKSANQATVGIIETYLEQHPNVRGVYFSHLLSSLYWPGGTQEDHPEIGARPFVDIYSLAKAHLSDTKIQMAAYGLRERFPGQVYSMAQFVMPKGFGKEWGHFREVVNATGIPQRFALDNISEFPFAVERYLFNAFAEFELDKLSDRELAEFLVHSAGGFFGGFMGIVEINWGKLIDGVIVYPSDAPLPKTQTHQEFMKAASDYVAGTIKDDLDGEG